MPSVCTTPQANVGADSTVHVDKKTSTKDNVRQVPGVSNTHAVQVKRETCRKARERERWHQGAARPRLSQRQTQTQRKKQRQRERERQKERQKERDRDREREREGKHTHTHDMQE